MNAPRQPVAEPDSDDGRAFAIAGDLLADGDDAGWRNLGLWTDTTDYSAACAALAQAVGRAAHLAPADKLLELACGNGSAFTVWQQAFGVRRITALERQRRCVDAIRAINAISDANAVRVINATDTGSTSGPPARMTTADACRIDVLHGRFDRPLPAVAAAGPFSAVVCVDAAYHADSLARFAQVMAAALETNGRFAFTTLLQGSGWQAGTFANRCLQQLLAQANIPAASVLPAGEATAVLASAGLTGIRIDDLDDAVLGGFADHVARRAGALSWRQKASAGWLKIRGTGALCRYVSGGRYLRYALVSGRRG